MTADRIAAALAAKTTKAAPIGRARSARRLSVGSLTLARLTPAPPDRPPPVSQAARRAG